MADRYREKIIALWSVFLLGLLFHTQLGLMPLFHSLDVAESHAQNLASIAPIMWLMLAFFVIPMGAIVGTVFTDTKRYRKFHFGLTVVYTFLNVSHFLADLLVPPRLWYQVTLMVILFAIGLLLNLVSFQWFRGKSKVSLLGKHVTS